MEKDDEPLEHKESLLYKLFWPAAHGETSSHAQQHSLTTCPTCEDDTSKCECLENDSLGG